MALSVREQAIRQAVALLGAMPGVAASTRSQVDQVDALPCFDTTPGEFRMEYPGKFGDHGAGTLTQPLIVRYIVDAAVAEDSSTALDDSALDAGYVWAVQQIVGATANMGGAVYEALLTDGATVFRPEGRDIIGLEMHFELIVGLQRGDPTQRG